MDTSQLLNKAEEAMKKAYEHVQTAFLSFRVNRVDPSMIKEIRVDYYGVLTPLYQVATITAESATLLQVKPWEKKLLPEIMKAITKQDQNDFTLVQKPDHIELHRRPLTEEGRKKMAKLLAAKAEEARISTRNVRKSIKQEAKSIPDEDTLKQLENKLQDLTDAYIKKIDTLYKNKEAEIMKV